MTPRFGACAHDDRLRGEDLDGVGLTRDGLAGRKVRSTSALQTYKLVLVVVVKQVTVATRAGAHHDLALGLHSSHPFRSPSRPGWSGVCKIRCVISNVNRLDIPCIKGTVFSRVPKSAGQLSDT